MKANIGPFPKEGNTQKVDVRIDFFEDSTTKTKKTNDEG